MITELAERAVASSDDRTAWLGARTKGVTATEIAKLAKNFMAAQRDIIADKLSPGTDDLSHIPAVRYGQIREDDIAAWIKDHFNLDGNRTLFHAAGNPRHLATPDGTGTDFAGTLVVAEIKTSKYDLDPKPARGYFRAKSGYGDQIQWQMYVVGASKALFVWEQHDDDWSGWPETAPKPLYAEPQHRWIERDEARIQELVKIADAFLIALDFAATGEVPLYDDELDTHAVNYLTFLDAEKQASAAKKAAWETLLGLLDGRDALTQDSPLARVTWTPSKSSTVVETLTVDDPEAAVDADPGLFAEYTDITAKWAEHCALFKKVVDRPVTTTTKANLRVTAVKQKAVDNE